MNRRHSHFKSGLALFALTTSLCLAKPAAAQNPPAQPAQNPGAVQNRDINRPEIDNFNRFLDSHPEIAEQLRKDPSLVDKRDFVKNHPALDSYLRDHPGVRDELKSHPDALMRDEDRDEDRLDRRDDARNQQVLASFNRFLDSHREISEQLQKDPSLADNRQFLQNHPALQNYLQDHPEARDEIRNDPNAFMQAEARYEHHDEGFDRDERNGSIDRDDMHRHFGEFLGSHSDVAHQLGQNPGLVKDQQFLQNHPELQDYLNQHPDERQELMANPDEFVKSSQAFTNGSQTTKPAPAKPKPNQ
jgi:hypothetical protein